jgi:hypothetical protein
VRAKVIERVLPGTYRMTAVARSNPQDLAAALLWAGERSAAAAASAGEVYGLEGVRAIRPDLVVDRKRHRRHPSVTTRRPEAGQMIRTYRGVRVTGIEATLLALAHDLDVEALEIACEDARRRRLTSIPALNAYLARFAKPGRRGVQPLRALLKELDPKTPSRSTLEVKTRRLLVANGITDFVREVPLEWNGKRYFFDFGFAPGRTILETNGRRWHDDTTDYEFDNEKWSVPGRLGYRIVFATWDKVTRRPQEFVSELRTTLAA